MGKTENRIDYRYTVKELPESERPREKLIKHGAQKLSNSELLALIIRTGNKKRTAIELSRDILKKFGGLNSLIELSVEEIEKIKGVGIAKSTQIKALIEISKRIFTSSAESKIKIKTPEDVVNLVGPELQFARQEIFKLILLDVKSQVIAIPQISKGGLTSSIVHPREVFKIAIKRSSAALILVHNHPSGIPEPSKKDIRITKRIIEAGEIMGIEVLDHVVIGEGIITSMKEKKLI